MMNYPYFIPIYITNSDYSITSYDILMSILIILIFIFCLWFFTIGIEKIKDFDHKRKKKL